MKNTLFIIAAAVAGLAGGWLVKPSGCCADLERTERDLERTRAMLTELQTAVLAEEDKTTTNHKTPTQ